MLNLRNLFFCHNVFKSHLLQGHQKSSLCWKGLIFDTLFNSICPTYYSGLLHGGKGLALCESVILLNQMHTCIWFDMFVYNPLRVSFILKTIKRHGMHDTFAMQTLHIVKRFKIICCHHYQVIWVQFSKKFHVLSEENLA